MALISYTFTGNSQSSADIKAADRDLIALSLEFSGASATVDLERRVAGGGWALVEQFTSDAQKNIEAVTRKCVFRCSTSAYTSGSVVMTMASPG